MSVYLPNDEQNAVIHSGVSLSNISYLDRVYAIRTAALHVYHLWKSDQKAVIVMPNEDDRLMFIHEIQQLGLQSILLPIHLEEIVTEKELLAIKNNITKYKAHDGKNPDSSTKFNWLERKITSFFKDHYEVKNTTSWRQTLDKYLAAYPNQYIRILDTNLDEEVKNIDKASYQTIRNRILDAQGLYLKEFDLIASLDTKKLLHSNAQNADNLHEVSYMLFTLKEVAETLRDRYYKVYQDIEYNYVQNVIDECQSIESTIYAIQCQIENKHPSIKQKSGIFQIFDQAIKKQELDAKQFLNDWNELQKKVAFITGKPSVVYQKMPENASAILQELISSLSIWKDKKLTQKVDFVKSVNKFNHQEATITDLENDLEALIARINQTNILHNKLEYNTLSFNKQREYVNYVVQQLDLAMIQIDKNYHYLQWKSFEDNCDRVTKMVLDSLKTFDQSIWLETYDTWYLWSQLTQLHLHIIPDHSQNISQLGQYFSELTKSENDHQLQKNSEQFATELEKLKKINHELYQSIWKSKPLKNKTTWKHLFADHNETLSAIFPIILTDSDHLESLKTIDHQHLIVFNDANINYKILQLFASVTNYLQAGTFEGKVDANLKMHDINPNLHIHNVSHSERLPLMRAITDALSAYEIKPSIFQLKDACIISFATTFITKSIVSHFYDLGIKQIFASDDLSETILSTLLSSEKHIYIITEEGVFSPTAPVVSIILQVELMQKLKHAGCEFLDIKLNDLLRKGEQTLTPMIDLIRRQQWTNNKSNKQAELELV